MAKHFSPEEDEDLVPERTKTQEQKQRLLLLLLLLLLVVFAYLYFFTGLIRPRPQAPPAQKVSGEAVVKKPLPPRVAEKAPEAPAGAKPAPAGGEAKAPAAQAKAGQPAAPPKAAPAEKGAPEAKGAKPAGPEAKPAAHEAKAPKAGTPESKAAKAAPAETKGGKPAAEAKGGKPAAEAKPAKAAPPAHEAKAAKAAAEKAKPAEGKKGTAKGAAEAPAQKGAAAQQGKAAPAKAKAAGKAAAPAYVLEIKGDLAESETGPVTAKLKKAGVATRVEKVKSHKTAPMHRLFLADFGNRDEALEELERLKLAAPEAFMLKENGRYAVYAGSYMRESKARAEQDRLYQKGVKLLAKSATVPVSVVKMRAGSFPDKGSAAKAAERLKKAGVEATVVKTGK